MRVSCKCNRPSGKLQIAVRDAQVLHSTQEESDKKLKRAFPMLAAARALQRLSHGEVYVVAERERNDNNQEAQLA